MNQNLIFESVDNAISQGHHSNALAIISKHILKDHSIKKNALLWNAAKMGQTKIVDTLLKQVAVVKSAGILGNKNLQDEIRRAVAISDPKKREKELVDVKKAITDAIKSRILNK